MRPAAPLGIEEFQRLTSVSRETLRRLDRYLALLRHWQGRINLVGRGTLVDPWRRHFLDSAQLMGHLPPGSRRLTDIGSGAGFPGLVLAVLGLPEVHLVEADQRKAVFLAAAARQLAAPARVHCARVESLDPWPSDVVTARACAPLPRLLAYAAPFLAPGGCCLLHKGARVDEELTAAGKTWMMRVERFPSLSDPTGTILRLWGPTRAR